MFLRRVRVLLYDVDGADIPNDLVDVQPASQLLVLAVACLGAPLSSHPEVAQPLYQQCRTLTEEVGYLDSSPLDNIEAINLLESSLGLNDNDPPGTNPLKLDPLAKGYAVELALYHKLNVCPVVSDATPDWTRRRTLFWSVWELDAIRMASARLPCRLADVNIGWASPGDASSHDAHMRLARVARQIGSSMLSVRAKTKGIREADVSAAISALDSLDKVDPSVQGVISAEQLFLQSTRNLLYLVCWVAAKDNDVPPHVLGMLDQAALHATERMAVLAQSVTQHNLLQAAPRAVRDHLAAFILFLVRKLHETQKANSVSDSVQYFALAEKLGLAVRSATVYRDSERLANILRDALYSASRSSRPASFMTNVEAVEPSPDIHPPTHLSLGSSDASTQGPLTPMRGHSDPIEQDLFSSLLATVATESAFSPMLFPGGESFWSPLAATNDWSKPPNAPTPTRPDTFHPNWSSDIGTQLPAQAATRAPSQLPVTMADPQSSTLAPILQFDDQGLTDFLVACGIGGPVPSST